MTTWPDFNKDSELFIGIVAPLGANRDDVVTMLKMSLNLFSYETVEIKMSQLIPQLVGFTSLPKKDKIGRIEYYDTYMDAGDQLREKFQSGDALAALSLLEIRNARLAYHSDKGESSAKLSEKPIPRRAYLINSLKHTDEANFFRKIYGKNFILISIFESRSKRKQHLSDEVSKEAGKVKTEKFASEVERLLNRDEKEEESELGQDVRGTFSMSDFFVNSENKNKIEIDILRFLDSLFGYAYNTPTTDEYAMFQASASALRSSSSSRQVGAAIVDKNGTLIALGCNEVPKRGGGFYSGEESEDNRDFKKGFSSNELKDGMFSEFVTELLDTFNLKVTITDFMKIYGKKYRKSELYDLLFLERTVHAEMAALIDAEIRGTALRGSTLYTTTFPCQNCAKHMIYSGVKKIVFVEPYPKSLADTLHNDDVTFEITGSGDDRVSFQSFMGIAPSLYSELFESTREEREKKELTTEFDRKKANLKISVAPLYFMIESLIVPQMIDRFVDKGLMEKEAAEKLKIG